MKTKLFILALFCASLFTTSCDSVMGGEKTIGEAVPVAEYKTYFASLKDNIDSEGKRISFEGYFFIGNDITYQDIPGLGKDLASITVYSEPLGKGELVQVMLVSFGDEKNRIYIPEEFSDEDLVVNTNDGEALPYNKKVKISGTVTYPYPDGTYNTITKKRDYHYYLVDVRFDPAA